MTGNDGTGRDRWSSAVLAGSLGFLGATAASLAVPHVVETDLAVGVVSALLTGVVVFVGVLAADRGPW